MEGRKKRILKISQDTPTSKNFIAILTQIFLALCALYSLYSIFTPVGSIAHASQEADRARLFPKTVKHQGFATPLQKIIHRFCG